MMDHFHFQVDSEVNYDRLHHYVVDEIVRKLKEPKEKNKKTVIGLSSGFTFIPIHRLLRDQIQQEKIDLTNVIFFLSDDRFVPSSHPDANSHKYLLQDLPNVTLYYPRVDTLQLNECVKDYNERIKSLLQENGKIDLMAVKMGEHGQVAGLFPPLSYKEIETDDVVIHTKTDKRPIPDRITVNLKFLENNCEQIILVLNTPSKHTFWDQVIPALEDKDKLEKNETRFVDSVSRQYPVANLLLKKNLMVVFEGRDNTSLA